MTQPFQPMRRRNSLGCLGVLSIFCLIVFTVLEGLTLLRMNPDWFDSHVAFWRGPVFEPDPIVMPASANQPSTQAPADPTRALLLPDGMKLDQRRAVEAHYDPTAATTIKSMEDATFAIPAAAARESCTMRLAPIDAFPKSYDPNFSPAGPCYKLFVGSHDHYQFDKPVHVKMHYLPELCAGRTPGIFVNQNGAWESCPTSVNAAAQTVEADITHCSGIVSGIKGVVSSVVNKTGDLVATGWHATGVHVLQPADATMDWVRRGVAREKYNSGHFAIYYTTSGDDAVPPDSGANAFPLQPQKKVPNIPNFVLCIAEALEAAEPKLKEIGVPGESYDGYFGSNGPVYLYAMTNYGETGAGGGPIDINIDFHSRRDTSKYPPPGILDGDIRATAVHEYIHACQHWVYGSDMIPGHWWMETSAAYLADLFWKREGRPSNMVFNTYLPQEGSNDFLKSSMDSDDSEVNYCYATLLNWLDRDYNGAGQRVAMGMYQSKLYLPQDFIRLVELETKAKMPDLIERLAIEYYHDDKWHGRLLPQDTYDNSVSFQDGRFGEGDGSFKWLTQVNVPLRESRVSSSWTASLHSFASATSPVFPPLTARAFIVHSDRLADYSKAKMLFQFKGSGGGAIDPNLSVRIMADKTGATLPVRGTPATPIHPNGDHYLVENVVVPGGIDDVTIVVTNRSTTTSAGRLTVTRSALMRPSFVNFARQTSSDQTTPNPRSWRIKWDPTDLYFDDSQPVAFNGWGLYRFTSGVGDFTKVKDIPANSGAVNGGVAKEWFVAPDDESGPFTTTVRDIYGDEGYPAIIEQTDPFEGLWSGSITLVEGSLSAPAKQFITAYLKLMDDQENKRIAAISDPADRDKQQKAWDDQKRTMIQPAIGVMDQTLDAAQAIAKLGLPVDFEIRKVDGDYYFGVTRLLHMYDTGMKPTIPLRRVGPHTLAFPDLATAINPPPGGATQPAPPSDKAPQTGLLPVNLRLHRENEIRDDYSFVQNELKTVNGTKLVSGQSCKIRWNFKRITVNDVKQSALWQLLGSI